MSINRTNSKTEEFTEDEFRTICKELGIDEDESKLSRVVRTMISCKLSGGWRREVGEKGKTVYYNDISNEITGLHPQIDMMKQMMIYAYGVYDGMDREAKAEADEEFKKKNRDLQTREMTLANSMEIEEGGQKEKVDVGNNQVKVLSYFDVSSRDVMKIDSEVSIKEYMNVHCKKYYEKTYGFPLRKIHESLLNSPKFKSIDVHTCFRIFSIFNIWPNESWLFKFAVLYEVLELPPEITEIVLDSHVEYIFFGNKIRGALRPTHAFIEEVLRDLKSYERTEPGIKIDKGYERPSNPNVDLVEAYEQWISNNEHKSAFNYANENQRK